MKLFFIVLFYASSVFAQAGPSEAEYSITESPDPNPSFTNLLASHKHPCSSGVEDKNCERNLIYEKDTESISQLISDGRDLVSGEMDINEVLRSPASYGGEVKTIELSPLFSGQQKFDSVIARYTKDQKIYIEVQFNSKKHTKTIDIP